MVLVITFIEPRKESNKTILNHTHNHRPTNLRWIKSFLYYKMDKKSIVKLQFVSSCSYISASSWLFNVRQKDIKDDSS